MVVPSPRRETSFEGIYSFLRKSVHPYLSRRMRAPDANDAFMDTVLVVWNAVCKHELRDIDRIGGFAMTVARRFRCKLIREQIRAKNLPAEAWTSMDPYQSAELNLIAKENRAWVLKAIGALRPVDSYILRQFYFNEASAKKIQADLNLTGRQFALLKTRAKRKLLLALKRESWAGNKGASAQ